MARITHRNDTMHRGLVPTDQLGTGTADSTTYLRGDQTWDTVSGSSLPTSSTKSQVLYATDTSGTAAWADQWYNVKIYGATGDGTTDDTTAINSAIAAINSAGRGCLFFPAGDYLASGALTTISVPCLILGAGMGTWDLSPYVSRIKCSSQTAVLFTISALYAKFQNLAVLNTYSGTPTSASTGIKVSSSTVYQQVDFDSVSASGFYTNIDIQVGNGWSMRGCWNFAPVQYGMKVSNTVNGDAGDWSISDSGFFAQVHNAQAAIHIESSGGGKIANVKINTGTDSHKFVNGIELSVQSSTSILLVSNCSFEALSGDAIHGTNASGKSWYYVIVDGCQFAGISGSAVNLHATAAGDFGYLVLGDNIYGGTGTNAITLTNADQVYVMPGYNGFTNLLSTTTCTNVHDYSSPLSNPMTASGDIIIGGSSGTPTRLASPGDSSKFLNGLGAYTVPPGTAGSGIGTYGLLVEDGALSPPVTLYTEDGTDWVYADG
jgi:Pectate lyase superfamily protein